MRDFNKKIPENFVLPTSLPGNIEESAFWQELNKQWWEEHPMRYDWNKELKDKEFSKEFFEEIDNRFFKSAIKFLPFSKVPFDPLINFVKLKDYNVLEIGVGMGSHASLLARYSGTFTGIDLTEYAVKSTLNRFEVFNLPGKIIKMDAESLQFDDNTFDFIWSWGVIHHSSHTGNILKEIKRVLKPGGEAVIMVYHRNFWNYYFINGFLRGIIMRDLFKYKKINKIIQYYSDGALARYYSIREWNRLVADLFNIEYIKILGQKEEIFPLPAGNFKNRLLCLIPDSFSKFLTNSLRMGSFLVSSLRKA